LNFFFEFDLDLGFYTVFISLSVIYGFRFVSFSKFRDSEFPSLAGANLQRNIKDAVLPPRLLQGVNRRPAAHPMRGMPVKCDMSSRKTASPCTHSSASSCHRHSPLTALPHLQVRNLPGGHPTPLQIAAFQLWTLSHSHSCGPGVLMRWSLRRVRQHVR
jgi:hypothetical protein